jgi:hypothetical protein
VTTAPLYFADFEEIENKEVPDLLSDLREATFSLLDSRESLLRSLSESPSEECLGL